MISNVRKDSITFTRQHSRTSEILKILKNTNPLLFFRKRKKE